MSVRQLFLNWHYSIKVTEWLEQVHRLVYGQQLVDFGMD